MYFSFFNLRTEVLARTQFREGVWPLVNNLRIDPFDLCLAAVVPSRTYTPELEADFFADSYPHELVLRTVSRVTTGKF